MHELLATFYFREEHGRALILQNRGEYAVFFLKNALFDDPARRDGEVKEFFELLALLRYLDRGGYITLYRPVTENMYFIQDYFDAPRVVDGRLLLDTKGNHSASPDTIRDAAGNTLYRGIILRGDHYRLVAATVAGTLLISDALASLLQPATIAPPVAPRRGKSGPTTTLSLLLILALSCAASLASSYWLHERMEGRDRSRLPAERRSSSDTIPPPPPELEKGRKYYGIDISKYNPGILTGITLHDSITFIICKATEGTTYTDPSFDANHDLIRAGDYLLGAYHFYRSGDNPAAQAAFFWKVISAKGETDIAPVVDVEQESLPGNAAIDPDTFQSDLLAFLDHLRARCRRVPIIYTNRPFANEYLTDRRFSRYPLWIADYARRDAPRLPETWKEVGYTIWQKKDNHSIASRLADLDVYSGKLSELTR
jgi:GH25 family lysozyme M1 (1,4-beta-N-acetylmuramidase)